MKRENLIELIERTVPPGAEIRIENLNIYDDSIGIHKMERIPRTGVLDFSVDQDFYLIYGKTGI